MNQSDAKQFVKRNFILWASENPRGMIIDFVNQMLRDLASQRFYCCLTFPIEGRSYVVRAVEIDDHGIIYHVLGLGD